MGEGMSEVRFLRRSMLFLAGSYPDMLAAYPNFYADMFCFDLEDSVPPDGKIVARERVEKILQKDDPIKREKILRVNGLDTPWGYEDLCMAARSPLDGVLLPKVEGAATVRQAIAILDAAGAPASQAIWCLIETPLGVLRAEEIATASPRVAGLVMGGSDFAETTHSRQTADRLPQLPAFSHCLLVARAYGLAIIDTVHPNFQNEDGFAESCSLAADWGFDGKSIALPSTIAAANAAFGPHPADVAKAQSQIDTFSDDANGYAQLVLQKAKRLVALDNYIKERESLIFGMMQS